MNANINANIKSGESKSMMFSTCKIHIMVKVNNKTWETGNVWMAFVQFQKSFFNFIFFEIPDKIFNLL